MESCDGFADVHSEHKIQLVQVRSGRTDIYMSACKVDEAHFKTIRSSAPGLRRVCAGSAPGLCRVCAGSALGLRRVCAGSAPGLRRVCAGSAPGRRRFFGKEAGEDIHPFL